MFLMGSKQIFQRLMTVNVRRLSVIKVQHQQHQYETSQVEDNELNVKENWSTTPSKAILSKLNESGILDNKDKEDADTKGAFHNYSISKETIKKLKDTNIEQLFSVQYETYAHIKEGNDCIVQARTGTGKTLAFALPILENLREEEIQLSVGRSPVALALAPTRELALQIYKEFEKLKQEKLAVSCIYGGAPYYKQEDEMRDGIDILVGTPGRIIDHLSRNNLDLSKLKYVVLDEADRMLDMGFEDSITEILKEAYTNINKPQTLLFSATVPPWVKQTSKKYLGNNTKHFDLIGDDINKSATTVEHKSIKCSYHDRATTINDLIQLHGGSHGKILVFTSTKQEANELAMNSTISADCQVLHGDISQNQRESTLQGFRNGKFNCLVATDVAARGLDIPEIDLVIQTEPPKDVESYIHRSGRTGRAGLKGVSIILYKPEQLSDLKLVEKKAGISFTPMGAPQQAELIQAYAKDAFKTLDKINDDVIEYFMVAAKDLIERKGAEQALAAALAALSGKTEISARSLLTSRVDHTAYIVTQNYDLHGTGLVWSLLKRNFDEDFMNSISHMRMTKDKKSCVFDIPAAKTKILKQWRGDKYVVLEEVKELPELVEFVSNSGHGSSEGRSNNRNTGYNNQSNNGRSSNPSYRGNNSNPSYRGNNSNSGERGRSYNKSSNYNNDDFNSRKGGWNSSF